MKKLILLILLLLPFGFTPPEVHAECAEGRECVPDDQETTGEPPGVPSGKILPGKIGGSAKENTEKIRGHITNKLLPRVINFTLIATISASVLLLIVGGIMYIFSMGESERISKGKEFILWALVGLAASVLAFTAVRIVTGIDFFEGKPPLIDDPNQPRRIEDTFDPEMMISSLIK